MDNECQLCGAPGGYPYCNDDCRDADMCCDGDDCQSCADPADPSEPHDPWRPGDPCPF